MGEIDVAMCEYLEDRERIADLFNGFFFQGRPVIRAENIEDYEEKYPVKRLGGGKHTRQNGRVRYRDIVKKLQNGGSLRILAMENQNRVDYTMPFRCMEYDTLEYRRQIDRRIRDNEKTAQWESEAEFLCGVRRTDRFAPVYTICLYHGKEAWDGPRSLRDMMDFGEDADEMSRYFADYPMKLFCVNEERDFSCFKTELRQFFTMISCREDPERMDQLMELEEYRNLSTETAEVLGTVLGWSDPKKSLMKYEEEGKGVNMCKALEDLKALARAEGEKIGIEQNTYDMIWSMHEEGIELEQICRISGKTAEEVQEILENRKIRLDK